MNVVTLANVVITLVMVLVAVLALVVTLLMARGPARLFGSLGFGLILVGQALGAVAARADDLVLATVLIRTALAVPVAVCFGLAIVLGYRAAQARSVPPTHGPVPPHTAGFSASGPVGPPRF